MTKQLISAVFSISDLERLSGIKAHTIRIWEQRYGIVKPKRTETNIRFYNENDLREVLNIALLNSQGFKISHIASMSPNEILDQVKKLVDNNQQFGEILNALTLSMLDLDEEKFEKILSNCIIKLGFEQSVVSVLYPFLERVGILWQTQVIAPAQEHFISNLIRHKLIVAADNQVVHYRSDAKKFVLFLPEGELHEIGLLLAYYLFRNMGHKVIYLGQTVPFDDLEMICKIYKPTGLFTVITHDVGQLNVLQYTKKLSTTFSNLPILISGSKTLQDCNQIQFENVTLVRHPQDLRKIIDAMK